MPRSGCSECGRPPIPSVTNDQLPSLSRLKPETLTIDQWAEIAGQWADEFDRLSKGTQYLGTDVIDFLRFNMADLQHQELAGKPQQLGKPKKKAA